MELAVRPQLRGSAAHPTIEALPTQKPHARAIAAPGDAL